MLWNGSDVLAQAIARALDLEHDSVVQEPIKEGGDDDGIAEDFFAFGEA